MRDQSAEIYNYIKSHPRACTEDIVAGTGWNRHLVEVTTELMVRKNLIIEVGRTSWNDSMFELAHAYLRRPD